MDTAIQVVVWTCVVLFVCTAVIATGALVGVIRLPEFYRRKLFSVLLVEIVTICVGGFASYVANAVPALRSSISGLEETRSVTLQSLESRLRTLELARDNQKAALLEPPKR